MAWYKTGTVSVTNNSATVTGSGTNFVSGAQEGFGFQGPNGLVYEITAINSSTSLTITPVYGGSTASGQAYAIVPTQGLTAALASDVTDLITDYQTVADNAGAGKFGDGSAASPGIRFVNDQDTGFFKDTANEIAVSVGGTKVGEFTSTGIDGTVIGGTTPAAITATSVTSTNDASVNGLTVGRGAGGVSTNTASGYAALYSNTTGSSNIANGYRALYSNTTGSNNTASGLQALYSNTTGSGNFGAAFRNSSGSYTPVFDPSTHSNRVVIGHTGVTNAYVQVAWTVVSDARDKTEIETLEKGLDFVNQLNPVSYKFRKSRDTEETDGKKRYGFLAQEVLGAEGNDNVIVDIEDADKLKMTNEAMIPVLVKAIQELKAEIETLKAQ